MRDEANVGDNLRRLLGAFLVRQDDLATALGISRQGLHNLVKEGSRSVPSYSNAARLARSFGISTDELFGDARTCLLAAVERLDTAPASRLRRVGGRSPFEGDFTPAQFQALVNPFLAKRGEEEPLPKFEGAVPGEPTVEIPVESRTRARAWAKN